MAEPVQQQRPQRGRLRADAALSDAPPVDPHAIDRAYRFYRAKRYARVEHRRETRMARARFWAFLGLLLIACAVVAVTVWSEVARIFGI
ncbi:MAG TPA: hypothetical protein VFB35_01315 [Gaiellaceae bacterium]|nr:hypothetical protein [Gaiellaceae bacterium]